MPLRPEALLLPGPPQGLPDQPVRGAHLQGGGGAPPPQERGGAPGAPDPHPHGGGRGQAHPRGGAGRPGPLLRGLQPGGRAPPGDRDRARPPQPRGGRGLPAQAPHPRPLPRHLRRQHAGGEPALRREHLAAPRGRGEARRQGRDQEHQFLPQPPPRAGVRGGAPSQAPGRGQDHRAGDPALERGPGRHPRHALQGVRPRLPLLPRPGPRPLPGRQGMARRSVRRPP